MDLFGTAGGLWTNYSNQQFAEEMASSQYQRAANDMKQAGLNPNAVFGSGGGSPAAAPGGQAENPVKGEGLGSSIQQIIGARKELAATDAIKNEAKVKEAQADVTRANAKIAQNEAEVNDKETSAKKTVMDSTGGKILHGINEYGIKPIGAMLGLGSMLKRGTGNMWGGNASAKQTKTANEARATPTVKKQGYWKPTDSDAPPWVKDGYDDEDTWLKGG